MIRTATFSLLAILAVTPALAQSNAGGTGASDVNPTAAGTAGTARESGTLGTRRGDSVTTPGGRETTGSRESAPGPNNPSTPGATVRPGAGSSTPETPAARQSR